MRAWGQRDSAHAHLAPACPGPTLAYLTVMEWMPSSFTTVSITSRRFLVNLRAMATTRPAQLPRSCVRHTPAQ